jgi:hypothetical protein
LQASHLPYRQLTGGLQYLATMSQPDIAYAVNKLSQYNNCWTAYHFEVLKGVLRYLRGTSEFGIKLGGSPDQSLRAYSDADHQGCLDTRRSTTGWVVIYHGGLLAWKSKRQNTVSHSTAESELMALDHCVRDVQWEQRGLAALGDSKVSTVPTLISIDNRSTLDLVHNATTHDSTKHIEARYFYIRDLLKAKSIRVEHVPGIDNPSDILTKPLPREVFIKHRTTLRIEQPQIKWES